MATKKSLEFSKMGYDLMDRKRNILIREMMLLIDKTKALREEIDQTFHKAYMALQAANISLGSIDELVDAVPVETGVALTYRSVMGAEITQVRLKESPQKLYYSLYGTNSTLDEAFLCFEKVKKLTVILAEVENSAFRLANAIRKTQRRANALKNIIIPNFEYTVKFITEALEEKEREEFSRLKVIKAKANR
jgi:V/A-type H+-transporting ATPase subunit D